MSRETLQLVRGRFSAEDPWSPPAGCEVVRLRRSADGTAPRLSTTVSPWFDADYLNVVFSAADDHVIATMTRRDDPLYQEDVVEVFLAPERLQRYYEIEVSPLGTIFDARIDSPDGERNTMKADLVWRCEGVLAAVRSIPEADGKTTVDTLIRIPFRALGRDQAPAGETWRANFFRIDRHPVEGDEYSAWRPTLRDPPDFHVPAAFGALKFRK